MKFLCRCVYSFVVFPHWCRFCALWYSVFHNLNPRIEHLNFPFVSSPLNLLVFDIIGNHSIGAGPFNFAPKSLTSLALGTIKIPFNAVQQTKKFSSSYVVQMLQLRRHICIWHVSNARCILVGYLFKCIKKSIPYVDVWEMHWRQEIKGSSVWQWFNNFICFVDAFIFFVHSFNTKLWLSNCWCIKFEKILLFLVIMLL